MKGIDKPLTWYYCDHCGKKFTAEHMNYAFHVSEDGKYTKFKLYCKDCDCRLSIITGDCFNEFANKIYTTPLLLHVLERHGADESAIELIRREIVPYYEQARLYIKAYIDEHGWIDPVYMMSPECLKTIIKWGLENE